MMAFATVLNNDGETRVAADDHAQVKGLLWSFVPDLLVAFLAGAFHAFLAHSKVIPGGEWWAILTALLSGGLYHLHNKLLLRGWSTEQTKIFNKLYKEIGKLADGVDAVYVAGQNSSYRDLGKELRSLEGKYDADIMSHVLKDQITLLQRGEHIITLDGYLNMLTDIAGRATGLYCINKTMPIYWFSPRRQDREFVRLYAEKIKTENIAINRLTLIEATNQLIEKQFSDAYNAVKLKDGDEELLIWCLILFQQIWDRNDRGLLDEIIRSVENKHRKKLENILVDLNDYTQISESLIVSLGPKQSDKDLKKNPNDRSKLADKLDSLFKDPVKCEKIDKQVTRRFVEKYGEIGSSYVSKGLFEDSMKEIVKSNSNYGEFGVYLDKQTPTKGFMTLGEFGSVFKIRPIEPSALLKTLKTLVEKGAQVKIGEDSGNMLYLLEK